MKFFALIAFAVLMNTSPLFLIGHMKTSALSRSIIPFLTLVMGVVELASPAFSLRVIAHASVVTVLIFAIFTILFKSCRRRYIQDAAPISLKVRLLDMFFLFILVLSFSGFAKLIEL